MKKTDRVVIGLFLAADILTLGLIVFDPIHSNRWGIQAIMLLAGMLALLAMVHDQHSHPHLVRHRHSSVLPPRHRRN